MRSYQKLVRKLKGEAVARLGIELFCQETVNSCNSIVGVGKVKGITFSFFPLCTVKHFFMVTICFCEQHTYVLYKSQPCLLCLEYLILLAYNAR